METRTVGMLQVSAVGLGCNNFGRRSNRDQSKAVVEAALESGITLFDTADVYGDGRSEEYLGAALGSRRDEVVVATKFGYRVAEDTEHGGGSARWIEQAVEHSLRRLGTDRIDLYQYHTPDRDTPIEETLGALDRLVRSGKVLEIGCSNFSEKQIEEARTASAAGHLAQFVSVQNEWSLLMRAPEHDGVVDACDRHGLAMLPYFPLAGGLLSGKYRKGEPPPAGTRLGSIPAERSKRFLNEANLDVVEQLRFFAAQRDRSLLELAISWLAGRATVASVIAGATKAEQVRANVAASTWRLTDEELAEVDRITMGG